MTRVTVAIFVVLRFITVIATIGDAFAFLVHGPVLVAARANISATTGRTADRTRHALVPFFVPEEPIRTDIQAASLVSKAPGTAQDALRLGRSIAGHAGRVTVSAVVVFSFVSIFRTGRVTLVFMHN